MQGQSKMVTVLEPAGGGLNPADWGWALSIPPLGTMRVEG